MQEIYSKNKSRIYAQGQKIIGQLAWIHKTLQSLVQIKKKLKNSWTNPKIRIFCKSRCWK